ncbi:deoxyribonuclease [Campylobacter coli]|uniref:Deoxyribonuclease n=1 Tax=Campylobacter coli TaxID=195 RepID=A0A690PVQ1_CAMCO|nr:endonuclease [Campylobacter coli]EAC1610394.1 deoxyribonuclease [Campylobacter jejuni]EAC1441340.1 deoxyribonuclease [Campylobacter coli]EAH4912691.1 deoxyribonuclease [Campylobacter coli]EAH5644897.1 deoxyribonuclease [Campylobacter coli]EAH5727532.1 deoxyribonuclease [Campylobacter coli]
MKKIISVLILALSLLNAKSFEESKKELVKFYNDLGSSYWYDFYCQAPFKVNKKGKINQRIKRIEWEHIMPAQNFGKHLPCWKEGGRKACKNDPTFAKMEADKQNLVPAIGEINGDRSNFRYAEAPTNLKYTQYGNCKVYTDFKAKRFYPANYSKGWIARSYLYMSKTYNIRLSDQERKLMEAWDKQYPIDEKEKRIRELL